MFATGLTEHALSEPAKVKVGLVEGVAPLLRHILVLAVHHDRGAAVEDAFGGALHHQHEHLIIGALHLVDGHLINTRTNM